MQISYFETRGLIYSWIFDYFQLEISNPLLKKSLCYLPEQLVTLLQKNRLHPYFPNPLSQKSIAPNPIVPISDIPNLNVPNVHKP